MPTPLKAAASLESLLSFAWTPGAPLRDVGETIAHASLDLGAPIGLCWDTDTGLVVQSTNGADFHESDIRTAISDGHAAMPDGSFVVVERLKHRTHTAFLAARISTISSATETYLRSLALLIGHIIETNDIRPMLHGDAGGNAGVLRHHAFAQAVNVELARDPRASMILIDIPGYRTLSDLLGYDFGLHVMLQVASRIREAVSATNIRHLIGHEGRDSFALFVRLQRASDLERLIARLREAMQEPVTLDERSANVRITIGSARAPEDGTTGEALLANAGLALSADVARSDAQSIHRTYSPVLRERSESRHSLLAQIHSGAVEAGEFAVFLQPTFSLDQNIAVGAEALVRWDHPTRGLLMPAEFLGLEPDGSTIVEIGRFVIDYVCAFIADRHDWDLPISINLAPEQLLDPRFASLALESIRSAGIQPGLITFEVLEDTLLNNSSAIEHNVIRLRSAGVRIALDDFGTGYSGLSHLSRMPVDILKVDRQFVERAEHDRDAIILEAIRFMAENLGLLTIAEGVETVRQRDALLRLGYTRGQGYFFCRPIRATGMPSWLAENQPKRQRAANE